jgi:hypothetical protein
MNAPLPRRERIRMRVMACVEVRDMGHVDDAGNASPCHVWTGPDSGNGRGGGYPRMPLDGQTMAVHKVVWTNENGIIPGKKQLDHKCRTRRCVREDHLEMVTHKQNQKRRDQARKA